MPTEISYGSASELARAMRNELQERGRDPLTVRPYQHQNPDQTIWWNIPSSQWPAYQHGKLFYVPTGISKELFCGLYVEKGIDPRAAAAIPAAATRGWIMRPNWRWNAFLADVDGPRFQLACEAAVRRADGPTLIEIESYYITDGDEFDSHPRKNERDNVVFAVDSSGLTLEETPNTPVRILNNVANSTTLGELTQSLRMLPRGEFAWVDVYVGSLFAPASKSGAGWNSSSLWTDALGAWEPWFM